MYTKRNLLPAKTASKASPKPELNCVAFYGNRTIGTDSFRLLEVAADGEAHEPKMIDASVIKKLKLKKDDTVSLEDIERLSETPANPQLIYPEVDQIINRAANRDDDEYVEVKINGRLLGELLQLMAKSNKFEAVTMRVPKTHYEAVYVETPQSTRIHKDAIAMRGLCMPMNK